MAEAPPALLLAVAFLTCVLGLAWLALAMDAHWAQVRGEQPLAMAQRRTLRALGALALAGAAAMCLRADHASMAALVWIMMLAAGVLAVAFTLAWRARWLRPLVWMLKTRRRE
jgi:hypothetical protein